MWKAAKFADVAVRTVGRGSEADDCDGIELIRDQGRDAGGSGRS